ncbi:MAG: zinc ribbon domain-containing protein [Raoultibacter sp.]
MFCAQCGAPLPDDAKFCPACGARAVSINLAQSLPTIEDVPLEAAAKTEPLADPFLTARMPKVESATGEVLHPASDSQKNYVQQSAVPKAWTTPKVLLLVVLIIVAVALFFFASQLLISNFARIGGEAAQVAASVQEKTAPAQVPSATETAPSKEATDTAAALDEVYSEMNIAYANVADYNAQIDDIVADFNSWYLASDASVRKDAAARCAKLKAKIVGAREDFSTHVAAAGCVQGLIYYEQTQRIDHLFSLLDGRVSAIDAAWVIDVSYGDPAAHEAEILAPIASANVAGKSKYLSEFEKLYPEDKPKKLH